MTNEPLRDANGRTPSDIKLLQIGCMAALMQTGVSREDAYEKARALFPYLSVKTPRIIETSHGIKFKYVDGVLLTCVSTESGEDIYTECMFTFDDIRLIASLERDFETIREVTE